MDNLHNVAWAAGFFEGEGYVGFTYQFNKEWKRNYPRLVLSISQVHREPLDMFKQIFGLGEVRGPYGPYNTTKQAYFQYQTSGEKAVEILERIKPFLFRKGEQACVALDLYNEYQEMRNAA